MKRVDLYCTVHKGIRLGLFETVLSVGRTAFHEGDRAAAAAAEVRSLLGFLEEHAEHEDAVLMPELAELAPELHADLRSEHARTDGLHRELASLLDRLDGAEPSERLALGWRLAQLLHALAAEHLRHLAREETEANRVLWAHRSDDELRALQGRILASIPPERMAEWLALMLPAMSAEELRETLAEMSAGMPTELFDLITGPARARLGEGTWRDALVPAR